MTLERKAGDTATPLRAQLTDSDAPIDLTSAATVTLTIAKPDGTTVDKAATPDAGQSTEPASGATTGRGWITAAAWAEADTAIDGTYQVEATIGWDDGTELHVPSSAAAYMQVNPTLD